MSDKVFPSATKPLAESSNAKAAASPPSNNVSKTRTAHPPLRAKPGPPPYSAIYRNRHQRRKGRNFCCRCCLCVFILLFVLVLLLAIAGAVFYVIYRPERPVFTVPSLRVHRFNLTVSSDSSTARIITLLNLTAIVKNPNDHISFLFDQYRISAFSRDTIIGNGTIPSFVLNTNGFKTFRNIKVSGSNELESGTFSGLRSDLKKGRVNLKIQLDTKVGVKIGKLKTKRVGIRAVCAGIRGTVPKGKTPTVSTIDESKCKIDLRIKVWNWYL